MYEKIFGIMTDTKTVKKMHNDKKEYLKYIINDVKYIIYHGEPHFITVDKHIRSIDFAEAGTDDLDIFMKIYSLIPLYKPNYHRLDVFKVGGIECNSDILYYNNNNKDLKFSFWFEINKIGIYVEIIAIFRSNKFLEFRYNICENDKLIHEYIAIRPFLFKIKEYGLIK